jgi:predicted nucleotidyltransferase
MTSEELRSYRPDDGSSGDISRDQQTEGHWEAAWETARTAAQLLRERFGADRVAAFGSLTHRDWFSRWSDVDLAAWRIPAEQFYRAVAAVTGISSEFQVNLVDPDACGTSLRRSIEREGIDL